ncbi:MAG: fluoride efflux transporter FluC [Thioalkalivibrionaceae bacterium]
MGGTTGFTMGLTVSAMVAAGGAAGTLARFWASNWMLQVAPNWFPLGTLLINTLGAFVIGVALVALVEAHEAPAWFRFTLMAGVLGGFTTVSGFALEFWVLWARGAAILAVAYAVATVILALSATGLGLWLGRHVLT